MLDFRQAKMSLSAARLDQCPADGLPEIVLAGKSNVGKSSLINALADQRKLARISQVPGKTRLLNFYLVNDQFYLVDLPGYGYARAAKEEQKAYSQLTDAYLTAGRPIRLIINLLDIRHEPTRHDLQMIDWLSKSGLPWILVLTKADKLSKAAAGRMKQKIAKSTGVASPSDMLTFSAQTKQGLEPLQAVIRAALN